MHNQPFPQEHVTTLPPTAVSKYIGDPLLSSPSPLMPKTPAQMAALSSKADLLLFGGAAGSLKSQTLLIDLIQERKWPRMRSFCFRRTYPELEELIERARVLFPQTSARQTDNGRTWIWPSGAIFKFRHCQHEKDVYQYQGQEITALGIDESTHFSEKTIRYLISRNRCSDPDVKTRVRLATNPGNVGGPWHQKLFFNGVCPHCMPDKAPIEGELRHDAKWPSDGRPLKDEETGEAMSVTYIRGNIRDHSLLGTQYISKLKMQNASVAQALLAGCWSQFEGQFFDCWDANRMVISRRDLDEQWWWPKWVSSDYGWTISTAAAHLYTLEPPSQQFPNGRIIILDELCQPHMKASAFAQEIVARWVLDQEGQQPEQRWLTWWISPDIFAEKGGAGGDTYNLANQMNAVLDRYGLGFARANNDRQGGAGRFWSMLDSGELVVCNNCRMTIDAIPSRVHDEKHENDYAKVMGDELDDVMDSARYGVYSYATASDARIPKDVHIAAEVSKVYKSDPVMGPTMAVIKHLKMQREEEDEDQPVISSGSARQAMRQPKNKRPLWYRE